MLKGLKCQHFVNNKSEANIMACELGLVYHTVKHNLRYGSLDCGNKLTSCIFADSETATKLSCAKTKAEMLVKNILAPKSVSDFVNILKSPESSQFFLMLPTEGTKKSSQFV